MTEKKRQEITEIFKYLRGNTPKKDIPEVAFDTYVSHLLSTIKDIPLHYQIKLSELKRTENFPEIITYLSNTLGSLVISLEKNEYIVKGLKHLSKYSKRNSLYDFIENKNKVLAYVQSFTIINPYILKTDLEIDGEKHHDICLLSKFHEDRLICIFCKKDLDFELALGLLSYLN